VIGSTGWIAGTSYDTHSGLLAPRVSHGLSSATPIGAKSATFAGDDRQTVNQRRRGDQGIAFGTWIGNVKIRATLRHSGIDGEDASLKARQNLIVYPCAENCALRRVPARNLERAQLDFEDGNG
jgi:hypothetical protein